MRTDRHQPPRRHRTFARPSPQGDVPFSAARLAAEAAFAPLPLPTAPANTPEIRIVRARALPDTLDAPAAPTVPPLADAGPAGDDANTTAAHQPVAAKTPRIFLLPSPAASSELGDSAGDARPASSHAASATAPARRRRRRSLDLARLPGPVVQQVLRTGPQLHSGLVELAAAQAALGLLEPLFEDIRFAQQWLADIESFEIS